MLIDTHAHLMDAKFDADREDVLLRAFESGLAAVVEIADRDIEWDKARELAERHPGRVFWAAGYHPHHADKADRDAAWKIRDVLKHSQAVALGEIGLDYYRNPVSPYDQQKLFFEMLQAAVEIDKPVVLHCREADASSRNAERDMLAALKSFFAPAPGLPVRDRGVLHCFQGNLDFAMAGISMGFYIGVDGPVTYPNAAALREVLKQVPLDRIVLETDSPYLPPQEFRGRRNEPAMVKEIARSLAGLKRITVEEVERQTTLNAENLYRVTFASR